MPDEAVDPVGSGKAMHPAYFEIRFRTPGAVDGWPAEFAILTAFATTGRTWTPEQNRGADADLKRDLTARAVWKTRVSGFSPSTGHEEPGWAAELPFEAACDLGLRFVQDAIYFVRGDDLYVSFCDTRRELVAVGGFRERLDLVEREL